MKYLVSRILLLSAVLSGAGAVYNEGIASAVVCVAFVSALVVLELFSAKEKTKEEIRIDDFIKRFDDLERVVTDIKNANALSRR
jgi:hypothetical protein